MSENKISNEEIDYKKLVEENNKLVSEKIEQIYILLNGMPYGKIKRILKQAAAGLSEKAILHI